MQTDTLIVGGGLSGLYLATQLVDRGIGVRIAEARSRLGGRILSQRCGDGSFDLGPAWFWPGQPRMARLVRQLDLEWFEQYSTGALIYEDERGQIRQKVDHASTSGSYRLKGGMAALTDALAARLPEGVVYSSTRITALERTDHGVVATTQSQQRIEARRCVIAMPPRLAAGLAYDPPLSHETVSAMRQMPTWMAGQAKAVALFEAPFWRANGLSGDVMSRRGPMVEIHDASPAIGGPYALFGFIGVPPQVRMDERTLRGQVRAQLSRLFGPRAVGPKALYIKDWAFDRFTSTELDLQPTYTHPRYGLQQVMRHVWRDRIIFGGTETAPQFGGYLEGALESAMSAAALLSAEEV